MFRSVKALCEDKLGAGSQRHAAMLNRMDRHQKHSEIAARVRNRIRSQNGARFGAKDQNTAEKIMIRIKWVYDPAAKTDGVRFLVERLWPRGMAKAKLKLDDWLKDVAPSTELRKWFNHDPARWEEFQRRYRAELDQHPEAWWPILDAANKETVTLLFSSHDAVHNNVVALKTYLDTKQESMICHSPTSIN